MVTWDRLGNVTTTTSSDYCVNVSLACPTITSNILPYNTLDTCILSNIYCIALKRAYESAIVRKWNYLLFS